MTEAFDPKWALNAERALCGYVELKRAMCAQDGGPIDLCCMAELVTTEGIVIVGFSDGTETLHAGLAAAVEMIPAAEIVGVNFLAETFFRVTGPGEATPARGDLQRAFGEGDLSVRECLTAMSFDQDGAMLDYVVTFLAYDDAGQPTFGEHRSFSDVGVRSTAGDAVRAVLTARSRGHRD